MVGDSLSSKGRESFAHEDWASTYDRFSTAYRERPLEPEDLERLAFTAYLLGRDVESTDLQRYRGLSYMKSSMHERVRSARSTGCNRMSATSTRSGGIPKSAWAQFSRQSTRTEPVTAGAAAVKRWPAPRRNDSVVGEVRRLRRCADPTAADTDSDRVDSCTRSASDARMVEPHARRRANAIPLSMTEVLQRTSLQSFTRASAGC